MATRTPHDDPGIPCEDCGSTLTYEEDRIATKHGRRKGARGAIDPNSVDFRLSLDNKRLVRYCGACAEKFEKRKGFDDLSGDLKMDGIEVEGESVVIQDFQATGEKGEFILKEANRLGISVEEYMGKVLRVGTEKEVRRLAQDEAWQDAPEKPDPDDPVILCPRCGVHSFTSRRYTGSHEDMPAPPALSRADNKTDICAACGQDEGLRQFQGQRLTMPEEWLGKSHRIRIES